MGINNFFESNVKNIFQNNNLENSNDIQSLSKNKKNLINEEEELLSNKYFYQNYLMTLASLINKNVIIFGDSKIGKTRLFDLLLGKEEKIENTNNNKQNFAYFEEKIIIINELEININVWDTPGEDKNRESNKHFIKDCIISYLCFHFNSLKSFESIQNYYYRIVKEINGKDAFVILLGIKNKIFDDENENETISMNTINNYAENNNILFYSVSLNDVNSVNYFFYDSIKKYALYKTKLNLKK